MQHTTRLYTCLSYVLIELVSTRPKSDTICQYIDSFSLRLPYFSQSRAQLRAETHGTARVSHMAFPMPSPGSQSRPPWPLSTASLLLSLSFFPHLLPPSPSSPASPSPSPLFPFSLCPPPPHTPIPMHESHHFHKPAPCRAWEEELHDLL